ncbi:MAG: reverse transcriptase domain-containing protein [Nanoarchaeota archaeon]
MKTYNNVWNLLCSCQNLKHAFLKARRRKSKKIYVKEFEKNLQDNVGQLQIDLLFHAYKPRLLETFIICDPKTRKISKSDFRDRIVHHALCNIIEPIFDKNFIHDSYANRKKKGTLKAVQRFDQFKRKILNKKLDGYVLKADIKHYFEEINHNVLLKIIQRKIRDEQVMWLIKRILENYPIGGGEGRKGCLWEILPRNSLRMFT